MIVGAKEKLQSIIDTGKSKVEGTLLSIGKEFQVRKDIMIKPSGIGYSVHDKAIQIQVGDHGAFGLTDHSNQQLYDRLAIPRVYAERLLDLGENSLLTENMNRMTIRQASSGLLFRTVGDQIKGTLSPSYKRMDASPIFESFVTGVLKNGMVPMTGHNTDYRYQVTFLYPELFEIVQDEHIVFTMTITTGDYGGVANSVHMGILRVICTNLATGIEMLRKIHMGSRFELGENESALLSQETHNLDTKTVASAITDLTNHSQDYMNVIRKKLPEVAGKEVSLSSALTNLRKRGVSKEISDQVETLYNLKTESMVLPNTPGLWRFSNAISAIAQSQPADRRIDLEREAMNVLGLSVN